MFIKKLGFYVKGNPVDELFIRNKYRVVILISIFDINIAA